MDFELMFQSTDSGYGSSSAASLKSPVHPILDWTEVISILEGLKSGDDTDHQTLHKRLVVTQPSPSRLVNTPCHLIINGTQADLEESATRLKVTIEAPVDYPTEYSIIQGRERILVVFRPLFVGQYKVSITLLGLGELHINGSPFQEHFSRDYRVTREIPAIVNSAFVNTDGKPWGIACNTRNEWIYVADRNLHQILVFAADGDFLFHFGEVGMKDGQFFRPTGIYYAAVHDQIIVSDKDNHRIQIFTADGQFVRSFGQRGHKNGEMHYPWGVAVSRDRSLIAIADSRNNRVQLFTWEGEFLRKYSVRESDPRNYKESFNYPRGIDFSLSGDCLYVSDFNLHTVFRLNIELTECNRLMSSSPLLRPQGLRVDDADNILVCCGKTHTIKVFNKFGQFISEIRSLKNGHIFENPSDITICKAGFISVLDNNGRYRVF